MDPQPGLSALGVGKEPAASASRTSANGSCARCGRPRARRDSRGSLGGARISRQEKLSAPAEEQEPQRLAVSRSAMRRGATPSRLAWRATAASRSLRASRLRKSATRRAMNGFSPATQISGPRGARLGPDDAALARTMDDRVVDAAQRRHRRLDEGDRLRQPRQPRADPGGVAFGEFARRAQRAVLRHRQQHVAGRGAHPAA